MTEAEYEQALDALEYLMTKEHPGFDDIVNAKQLSAKIAEYEDEHVKIDTATPASHLKYIMDQQNISRGDLAIIIGSRSKVSEVLSGKRQLSKAMIRALVYYYNVSAELLLGELTPDEMHRIEARRDKSKKERVMYKINKVCKDEGVELNLDSIKLQMDD